MDNSVDAKRLEAVGELNLFLLTADYNSVTMSIFAPYILVYFRISLRGNEWQNPGLWW